jgi:hypothetical protein
MPVEPNDHNLPLGGKLYPPIKRSFDAQARLVVDRLNAGRKSTFFTPAELLGPNDPQLRDELPRIIPVISGIWDKSGKRLYGEIGFDPERWRVTSEYLRSAIQDSAMQFAESTQATFREDLALTCEQIRQEIRDDIEASRLREGESLSQLTKRVAKYFTETNRWRARRIAQTEATRAHHLARERSAIETGGVVQGWEWVTTSQSCPLCDAVARDVNNPTGKRRIRIGMPFAIRGTNPVYSTKRFPPLHPACRCTVRAVLDPIYSGSLEVPTWSQAIDFNNPQP